MVQMIQPQPGWADYLGKALGEGISGGFDAYQGVKKQQREDAKLQLESQKEERKAQMEERAQELKSAEIVTQGLKLAPSARKAFFTYAGPVIGLDTSTEHGKNFLGLLTSEDEATQTAVVETLTNMVGAGNVRGFLAAAGNDPEKAFQLANEYRKGNAADASRQEGLDLRREGVDLQRERLELEREKANKPPPADKPPPGYTWRDPGNPGAGVNRIPGYEARGSGQATAQRAKFKLYAEGSKDLTVLRKILDTSGPPSIRDTLAEGAKEGGGKEGGVLGTAQVLIGGWMQSDVGKQFFAAAKRMNDKIEKAFTGATSAQQEQLRYAQSNIPQATDDAQTIADKIAFLEDTFETLKQLGIDTTEGEGEGAPAPSAAPKGVPEVTDDASYKAVGKGDKYFANGRIYTKGQ